MFVTSPSLFHSRHFERPLSRGFGPRYIALGIHFGTHLEKNSVRFEESVLDRALGPFWICFLCSIHPQREPLWNPFRLMLPSRGAVRLKIEDFEGVWLQSLFVKEILHYFWRGLGQWKRWFRMGGVAKMTISPKSEFYHCLSPFWRLFWSQNLSKMALGLAMCRPGSPSGPILGGPKICVK